jgi:tetratricopeptide (TPR) repeat protein
MPADVHIEEEADGARTVWMSEHDPLNRLKGMHGVRLRPDSALVELRVRLYNRTPFVHTFLWWANVAAKVHDHYQSFFPPDVHYVADHAVRATSSFPIADGPYYGIDYQNRPGTNDLGWYKNIPVPTSYMVCQTDFDFFGGYDFAKKGGFVHIANRHIAPGKKQWTWGNDKFGWAWDRELTDEGGPYVELMAGAYTDNQPDFSYLLPYETKTFSQFWWPIQEIGPVQQANDQAALACTIRDDRTVELGLCASSTFEGELILFYQEQSLLSTRISLKPGESWRNSTRVFAGENSSGLRVELRKLGGELVLAYRPVDAARLRRDRDVATEPPEPEEIASVDELFLTGEHLEQYRHPTRDPEPYWQEALARDPADFRCHTALGKRALNRGEFENAGDHFQAAVDRLTRRHPNPVSGEAHYHLGITYRWLGNQDAAYRALYKATWNYEWRSSAFYQLATIDCKRGDWTTALDHLEASLDTNRHHNKAHVLTALVLHHAAADPIGQAHPTPNDILTSLLSIDPLDHWARHVALLVAGASCRATREAFLNASRNDAQTILDLAFDYSDAGFCQYAIDLLNLHHASEVTRVAVPNPLERTAMTHYTLAWLKAQIEAPDAGEALASARSQSPDYFFPSRLEEMGVLQWALGEPGADPVAAYGLGDYLFDKRRHADAIDAWERAADANTTIPQVYRNLGIAYWNHQRDGKKAAASYDRALQLDPSDARLVSEYDQLAKKRNRTLDERLAFLEAHRRLVLRRDDATVELATLYNLTGRPQDAVDLLTSRRFHPWEGGEGAVLRQYTTARLLLGQAALDAGDAVTAHENFSRAMDTPESLGEAYHPLQAQADVNYWLGRSLISLGRADEARDHFRRSAQDSGDFAEMAVTAHSPLSYYRGLSLRELGRENEAAELFRSLLEFAQSKLNEPAKIDYFATSLPNLLVFDEDLQSRRNAEHHLLMALAHHGLGDCTSARACLKEASSFDRSKQQAAYLDRELNLAETGRKQ